jgi:hypothetical protein
MRLKTIIIVVIIFTTFFFYIIIMGGPIPRSLKINSCNEKYIYFLTNNFYCNYRTSGHCPDNNFEFLNANNRAGNCLCDKYLKEKNPADSLMIINLVRSSEYLGNQYKNITGDEELKNIQINTVINNKDKIFGLLTIE